VLERKVTTYEVNDGVAVVTLNRPDRLNAWTQRMEHEYRVALADADADPHVRVIVVTGAGRGFCAGADTDALSGIRQSGEYGTSGAGNATAGSEPTPKPGSGVRDDFEHSYSFHYGLSKPVIAAVNGPAAGVGFVLMCFADIRIAAEGAKLTTSFGRLGLPAEHGVSWVLSRLVGTARAADLLFSSRAVLAEDAVAMGLVNEVVPREQLMERTLDYARKIASEISPWSLRAMKRQLYADQLRSLDESAREAVELMNESFRGADFKEGVAALVEKRAPNFEALS
jgi:enoyl-CoA hydratase/carnithine racemase